MKDFPFVSENTIETIASQLVDEAQVELAVAALSERQPMVLAYLLSENFRLLTREEREYLLYIGIIICHSIYSTEPPSHIITQDLLDEKEEANWEKMNNVEKGSFRDKLDIFFKDYPQEDLLAYLEDSLAEDDSNNFVTKDGKGLMFIGLKTIIDCLARAN